MLCPTLKYGSSSTTNKGKTKVAGCSDVIGPETFVELERARTVHFIPLCATKIQTVALKARTMIVMQVSEIIGFYMCIYVQKMLNTVHDYTGLYLLKFTLWNGKLLKRIFSLTSKVINIGKNMLETCKRKKEKMKFSLLVMCHLSL